jgi:hypothetical protein
MTLVRRNRLTSRSIFCYFASFLTHTHIKTLAPSPYHHPPATPNGWPPGGLPRVSPMAHHPYAAAAAQPWMAPTPEEEEDDDEEQDDDDDASEDEGAI